MDEKQYGYTPVEPPEGIRPVDLMASTTAGPVREPAPTERVLCLNRGRRPIEDTFDARHLEMPPGYFYIEYAAAKHFQERNIVPGTKSAVVGGAYVSWISICGVNPPEMCQPFTDEELAEFGEAVEAIDRRADYGFGSGVKVVPTSRVRAASPMLGMQRGPGAGVGIDATQQATEDAAAAATAVLEPPAESATREDAAEAAAVRAGAVGKPRRHR